MKAYGSHRPSIWLVACLLLVPFSAARAGEDKPIRTLSDLNGRHVGILSGTMHDNAANLAFDYTQLAYYDDMNAMLRGLLDGDVDAVLFDDPSARIFVSIDPRFRKLPGNLQDDDYAFAFRRGDDDLHRQVDGALNELIDQGVVLDLIWKWVTGDDSQRVMPEDAPSAGGPPLRFGVCPISIPFAYVDGQGRVIGMEIELARMIADRIGRTLEVAELPFHKLVPALLEGQVDVIGSAFSITRERAEVVRFSKSFFRGGVAALVRADHP